jgi:hypothetical protein
LQALVNTTDAMYVSLSVFFLVGGGGGCEQGEEKKGGTVKNREKGTDKYKQK